MHIFTYGTLMFPEVWRAVVGRRFAAIQGTAAGFAIYRVRDAVFPGIVAAGASHSVTGIVYLNVDERSLERLDRFEDDFYRRTTIEIDCADGERRAADAYVVPIEGRSILTHETWDADTFVASGGLAEFIQRFAGFVRLANQA
jgi:gamma-glutamylcyclotransferase (GGCT)/AIG2-like uncharacterized protein YtfP